VLISVKLPQAPPPPTKVGGKQVAVVATADTPVFDVTPARCTIQPGSHVFTTVTFSPLALQVQQQTHSCTLVYQFFLGLLPLPLTGLQLLLQVMSLLDLKLMKTNTGN